MRKYFCNVCKEEISVESMRTYAVNERTIYKNFPLIVQVRVVPANAKESEEADEHICTSCAKHAVAQLLGV